METRAERPPDYRRAVVVLPALIAGMVAACSSSPELVTVIEFDTERRIITTREVSCVTQPDESVVILVTDGPRRKVRLHIGTRGRITVYKAGIRHGELQGFVDDPAELVGTKVDDTFTVRGRMPPADGETAWHTFSVETTCPGYRDAAPQDTAPKLFTS